MWILEEIQRRRLEIEALSSDDLRRAVAQSLDLSTWPGDHVIVLRIIQTYGPGIHRNPLSQTFTVHFGGTNGSCSGLDFIETLLRAWLAREL